MTSIPLTATEHRSAALDLLETAQRFPLASDRRPTVLAEAQLHALLALSAPDAFVSELTGQSIAEAAPETTRTVESLAGPIVTITEEAASESKPRAKRSAKSTTATVEEVAQ